MQEELNHSRAAGRPVRRGRGILRALLLIFALLLIAALACAGWIYRAYRQEITYYLEFGVKTHISLADGDGDGLADNYDMVRAAREYVLSEPEYDGTYFAGGFPPEGRGVCTDVIWRAFAAAGYDFKAMVDADIWDYGKEYPLPNGLLDKNIDFRRVINLQVFFERNGETLTTDASQIDQWQPGDVVFYEGHVAMVSDRRNDQGVPWIIHHTGQGAFEEDALTYKPIIGHYRWSAPESDPAGDSE